jgi:molybdopterin-guanine dinucleotide biosynthesis protein A
MCAAAILAGGRARRLGSQDKGALIVGGVRIVDRQHPSQQAITPDVLVVVSDATRAAAYAPLGLPVVVDRLPGAGALGGLYTAVTASPQPRILAVACDMPFLDPRFLAYLAAAAPDADVTIPRTADGLQPLCAVYARSCAAVFRRRVEDGALKVADALAGLRVQEVGPDEIAPFDPAGTLFFNVNTLEDYARALDLVEAVDG